MSIHDNVFDLMDAIHEQQQRERVIAWLREMDEVEKIFCLNLARYLEKHPERRAALAPEEPNDR